MDDDAVLRAWIALERFETSTLGRLDRSARARAPQQRRYADDANHELAKSETHRVRGSVIRAAHAVTPP